MCSVRTAKGAAASASAIVLALREEKIADLPDAAAEESFSELQLAIDQLELERLRRLADLERRGIHQREGHVSAATWLAATFRTPVAHAQASLRTARSLGAMPLTVRAVQEGDVSLSGARMLAIAQLAEPEAFLTSEATLVEAARTLSIRDLNRATSFWRERAEQQRMPDAHERRIARRRLHASPTLDGMVRIDGDLDPETGESVLTALTSVLDSEARSAAPDERTPAQRRADALGEICRAHLDRGDRAEVAGERPHVTMTVDATALPSGSVIGELDHTGPVGGHVVRRLICDASVTRVVMAGRSEPLDVGRRTPVVSASMRKAVVARDRHCRFPGCDRPHSWCDAHHVRHWADGGPTAVGNLLLLCRRHHRSIHQPGGFGLELVEGQPVFRRPDGSVLVDEPCPAARDPG
ncbi:MAG: DUF222 domain-containing protein [Actinomycetota bacterium]